MKLAIYGSGGLGMEVKEMAELIGKWDEIIFIDDTKEVGMIKGYKTMPFSVFKKKYDSSLVEVIIALGTPKHRKTLYDKVKRAKYSFANVISPKATISKDAKLGTGIIVEMSSYIGFDATISDNTFISGGVCVGHHTIVGKHCVVLQYSVLAGGVLLGDSSFVGQNSTIRERTNIGDKSVISMSSAVFNDVPSGMVVMGNPARIIAKNDGDALFK